MTFIGRADETGREDTAALLRDLSRSERERREKAPPARLVLTDDNLATSGDGARLTFSGSGAAATTEGSPATAADAAAQDELANVSEEERYWRSRALETRQRWRRAHDEIPRLEDEVERLRTAFYAEDDPVRRDRQVKPLWDRALDRLQEAQVEVESAQDDLELLLAEGVAAGALPGWLREGNELEPLTEAPVPAGEQIEENAPGEPVIIEAVSTDPPAR